MAERVSLALGGAGRFIAIAVLLTVGMLATAAHAAADQAYAPLDQPGPPLSIPQAKLDASMTCTPTVHNATREPVLLNPATGVTADQNYSWNWEPALNQLGIPWCAYTAPNNTLADIQDSGEYLVYNIRKMYAMAGRPIAVIGHSQGGMSMRWPLRFWPDTRPMVDDIIGFSGSNHGTTVQPPNGCSGGCPPADWQQFAGSNFIKAINSYAETFPGISYTEVYTHTDEVVQPASDNQTASAALHTGGGQITNVAIQDICPLDPTEHNGIGTVDNTAYALAIDALTHPGPADPSRISPTVCAQGFMPGVNPASANSYEQILAGAPGLIAVASPVNLVGAPEVNKEPPLRCYVFASCANSRFAPQLHVAVKPRRPRAGKRLLRFHVWVVEGRTRALVGGVRIRIGRHKLRRKTNSHGVLKVRRRLLAHHTYRIVASRSGCASARARLRTRTRR